MRLSFQGGKATKNTVVRIGVAANIAALSKPSTSNRSSPRARASLQYHFPSSSLPDDDDGGGKSRSEPSANPSSSSSSLSSSSSRSSTLEDDLPLANAPRHSRNGWRRDGSYGLAMSPRPHEVDESGVVTSTSCDQYTYAARYALFAALGTPFNWWQSQGVIGVTINVSTTFASGPPMRLGDKFYATSAVKSVSAARVVLVEEVRKIRQGDGRGFCSGVDSDNKSSSSSSSSSSIGDDEDAEEEEILVSSSEVTCAFVDEKFKPRRIPAEMKTALLRGAAMFKEAAITASSSASSS